MSGILLNVGAMAAIWGLIWRLWDNSAFLPVGLLMGIAIVCLIAGGALA